MSGNPAATMTVRKTLMSEGERKRPPSLQDEIPFGKVPSNHMLVCDYLVDKGGWQTPEILPYMPFSMSPHALVLHYAQEIFEGLKAYRSKSDPNQILLFRPDQNAARFEASARRMAMEPVPPELFVTCVRELVRVERDWVLPSPGSLYIRPAMIAWDNGVSVAPSKNYRFFIVVSPVKNYYAKELGVAVAIEREMVRAVPGGMGAVKCGGNYAASLLATARAKSMGCDQVLWLDGFEHRYVEEVGAMNVMFVYENEILTPALSGSILPGITRASILQLAGRLGLKVRECRVNVDEVLADARSGKLKEAFGCGTAAVVSPVVTFLDRGERIPVGGGQVGEVAMRLKTALTDIQTGAAEDPFGWRTLV